MKKWYETHPDWKYIRVRPIKLDGPQAQDFYIGDKGDVYRVRTDRKTKSNIVNFIDCVATDELIRNIYYDEQSNSIDELESMRLEDTQLAKHKRYDNQKRPRGGAEQSPGVMRRRAS